MSRNTLILRRPLNVMRITLSEFKQRTYCQESGGDLATIFPEIDFSSGMAKKDCDIFRRKEIRVEKYLVRVVLLQMINNHNSTCKNIKNILKSIRRKTGVKRSA